MEQVKGLSERKLFVVPAPASTTQVCQESVNGKSHQFNAPKSFLHFTTLVPAIDDHTTNQSPGNPVDRRTVWPLQ